MRIIEWGLLKEAIECCKVYGAKKHNYLKFITSQTRNIQMQITFNDKTFGDDNILMYLNRLNK